MLDLRVRNALSDEALAERAGKVLTDSDYDVLLTGPARVHSPSGKLLSVYLPGVLADTPAEVRDTLSSLKSYTTNNRGLASGTLRIDRGVGKRSDAKSVASAIVGAMDPAGPKTWCRLTAWTGTHAEQWTGMVPLLQRIAEHMQANVPDRFAAQAAECRKTDPAWVIPGTPFTTVTVNNSYPTGAHTDKGDLDDGFSTLACFRRGSFTGGVLIQPRYRVGVEMQDGDLLLMDAHEWHGNTHMTCQHGARDFAMVKCCGAERCSVVSYMRSRMTVCGAPEDEARKAAAAANRGGMDTDAIEESELAGNSA